MDGVGHVDREHEGPGQVGREVIVRQAEGVVDAVQDVRQDVGVRPLFRLAADFFVVEEGDDVEAVGSGCFGKARQAGQDRRQIVQARRRYEFIVPAQAAAFFIGIDRQVPGQDGFGQAAAFFRQEIEEEMVRQLALVQAHEGQQVFLRVEFDTFIGPAVHVDGQAGNGQDRSPCVDEADFRLEGIAALEGHGPGQGQGTVEPRFAQQAAVDFGVQLEVAVLADFRPIFYSQTGEIRMGRAQAQVAAHIGTRAEGDEARIIEGDVIGTVRRQLPRFGQGQGLEAGPVEIIPAGLDRMVRRRAVMDKIQ